jgi:rubrerythrin
MLWTVRVRPPEGEQQAIRQYTAMYNKFKREAEAVLDSLPLPMGHRETVRAYFEAIRPSSEMLSEQAEPSEPTE